MKKQSGVIIGFLLVLVIVLFAVLNNKNVPVSFGVASFSAPLILVIIGSAYHRRIDCFCHRLNDIMATKKTNQTVDTRTS